MKLNRALFRRLFRPWRIAPTYTEWLRARFAQERINQEATDGQRR